MKARLLTLWEKLHTSFWFVPGFVVSASVALAAATLAADRGFTSSVVAGLPLFYRSDIEGARALLATVAGSMITVTGVTFSVMVVAFTLASSQFTPRLLRNFMRDTGNQVVLGIFIGTFSYCLCVLRVIGEAGAEFIPRISMTCAFVLTAVSIGALVYFIHHAASLIQAQAIIATIGRELECALQPLYPRGIGQSGPSNEVELPDDFAARATEITSTRNDYVEAIDGAGLIALAEANDIIIELEHRPGDFAVFGEAIARAYPRERISEAIGEQIGAAFLFGPQRTQTQDPEFVLHELVEIAVRALSPAINDPMTAVLCVDRLAAALATVAAHPRPSAYRYSQKGALRIVAKHYGFRGLVEAAFNPIRQYGRNSVAVTIRLLEAIRRIALHAQADDREVLVRQALMVQRGSKQAAFDPGDREDIDERFRAALEALGHAPEEFDEFAVSPNATRRDPSAPPAYTETAGVQTRRR